MPRHFINPPELWESGPRGYSHVVRVSSPQNLIFVAGQAAVGPDLKMLADDIEGQTRTIFENLKVALAAADSGLHDVVDMTVYLRDIAAHQWAVRSVRSEFFPEGKLPVSTMIEVSRFALDEMLIEIDVIAAN